MIRYLKITNDRHCVASRRALAVSYWSKHMKRAHQAVSDILGRMQRDQLFGDLVKKQTVRIMLFGLFMAPDPLVVSRFAGLDPKECISVFKRMRANGILTKDGAFSVDWFDEEKGAVAIMMDAMAIEGFVTRTSERKYKEGEKQP